jgi:hypothetical protein
MGRGKADFGILRRARNQDPQPMAASRYHVVRVYDPSTGFLDMALTDSDLERVTKRTRNSAVEETLVSRPSWKDLLCAWIMRLPF